MDTLVLATRNEGKVKELRSVLDPLGIQLKSSADFPELEEVIEDRETLEGNACKKARYTSSVTGYPALADDTGLEVNALAGRPGVYSARYAGADATDQQNINKLLNELNQKAVEHRKAQFRTVIALVSSSGSHTFEGICPGMITNKEQGEGGCGYDPVFVPQGYEQTFAELNTDIKNKISHRGKAIQQLLNWLKAQ